MSSDLKVGDVCVIQLPPGSCEACARHNGAECSIVALESPGIRVGCNRKPELGSFYLVEVAGVPLPMALRREELRKKPPKSDDDSTPRTDFTPCEPSFVEDLQRRLTTTKEHA